MIRIRLLGILLGLLVTLVVSPQLAAREVSHTVKRGESLERIAASYGVTPTEILSTNKLDRLYTGITLKINVPDKPDTPTTSQSKSYASTPTSAEQALADEAERHFSKQDYGKAVKVYNKLLKINETPEYYFNRGLAQFKRGKNRQAAEDMSAVKRFGSASSKLKKQAEEVREVAQARHDQWVEERNQTIGAIVGTVLAAGASTYMAIETSKAARNADSYTPVARSYNTVATGYDTNVFNSLMAKTISDVNQEKMNVINGYRSRCAARGYTPTDMECEQYYSNYLAINYGGSDSSSSFDSNSGSSSSSSSNSSTNLKLRSEEKTCHICHGTGKCTACGGDKVAHGLGLTYHCNVCNDKGQCTTCHGTGKVYDAAAARENMNRKVENIQNRRR